MNASTTMSDVKSSAGQAADDAKKTASRIADEAKSGADKALSEAKSSGSAIGTEVKNFIADLEDLVTSKTSVDVAKIKNDIGSRVSEYKRSLEATGDQVISQAKKQAEGVNSYVHEDPWKAIGVGFAVGLLLGVVIARR